MTAELPPSNPGALGLHLTDLEYTGLLQFVTGRAMVGKAWVYGSRHTGKRRMKDSATPPDIDLAIELQDVPAGEDTLAMFEIRWSASEFFTGHPQFGLSAAKDVAGTVQIEFPGKEGSTVSSYIAADGATLIYVAAKR